MKNLFNKEIGLVKESQTKSMVVVKTQRAKTKPNQTKKP